MDDVDIIFYMSEASVASVPCLAELQHRESREVCNTHNGKSIPMIPVEVQPVGTVSLFRDKVYRGIIDNDELSKEEKNQKASTLSRLMDSFFPDNDRLRILSEQDSGRRREYYPEIEQYLEEAGICKATIEERYEQSIKLLADQTAWKKGMAGLDACIEEQNFLPAILMRAFLYETGLCGQQDSKKAGDDLFWGSMQTDESEWVSLAKARKEKRKYAEAAAYYMAHGMKQRAAEDFLEASKMWMKMSNANQGFAIKCAELAGSLNSTAGVKLYEGLKRMPAAKFKEFCREQK